MSCCRGCEEVRGTIYTIGAQLIFLDALRSLIKWEEIVNTTEIHPTFVVKSQMTFRVYTQSSSEQIGLRAYVVNTHLGLLLWLLSAAKNPLII